MSNIPSSSKSKIFSPANILLLAGILCIAINLRPALAAVGPLVNDIRQATGLSNSMLGLLTTLPLIAFGVVSTLTPLFTGRFGIGGTLAGAMLLLAAGIGIRSAGGTVMLYFGTLLFGIAIAFGNVLLPGLTKRNFSSNSGFVTSLYSSVMALGASLAAGISVPLAQYLWIGLSGLPGGLGPIGLDRVFRVAAAIAPFKKSGGETQFFEGNEVFGPVRSGMEDRSFHGAAIHGILRGAGLASRHTAE
ncbi:hypothetical protein [Pricia sp.]|uniref:hypothetical protein n=1 Tax=Pricia sp. TaxID=2268138 RepID=UPI0035946C19